MAEKGFVSAVIVAAGSSRRMGGINKLLLKIKGKEVLCRSVEAFDKNKDIDAIIVAARQEDIEEYSQEYNPNVLILEEMRLVEGVKVAVAIKTYPDGKVTGKIRCDSSAPIADKVAGYFGGGGHPFAAGFRTYDTTYDEVVRDLVRIVPELSADV